MDPQVHEQPTHRNLKPGLITRSDLSSSRTGDVTTVHTPKIPSRLTKQLQPHTPAVSSPRLARFTSTPGLSGGGGTAPNTSHHGYSFDLHVPQPGNSLSRANTLPPQPPQAEPGHTPTRSSLVPLTSSSNSWNQNTYEIFRLTSKCERNALEQKYNQERIEEILKKNAYLENALQDLKSNHAVEMEGIMQQMNDSLAEERQRGLMDLRQQIRDSINSTESLSVGHEEMRTTFSKLVEHYEQEYSNEKGRREELDDVLSQLKIEIVRATSLFADEKKTFEGRLQALKEDNDNTRTCLEDVKKESEIRQQDADLRVEALLREKEGILKSKLVLECNLASEARSLEQLELARDKLNGEIKKLYEDRGIAREREAVAQKQLEELRSSVNDSRECIKVLELERTEQKNELSRLRHELDTSNTAKATLEALVSQLRSPSVSGPIPTAGATSAASSSNKPQTETPVGAQVSSDAPAVVPTNANPQPKRKRHPTSYEPPTTRARASASNINTRNTRARMK
ncbi:unnamed protein product [Rhizoctonia solani]|uniref:Uncharacterized protein n=1 Tax=Rhizoctonia solani TaxID=456999 RepID=A0A8H3A509_9AGAM|nr:unnamed protein product [Rhizoctonia solani]